MLQFTNTERLGNKKVSREEVWISLERKNRRDFVKELRAGGLYPHFGQGWTLTQVGMGI